MILLFNPYHASDKCAYVILIQPQIILQCGRSHNGCTHTGKLHN